MNRHRHCIPQRMPKIISKTSVILKMKVTVLALWIKRSTSRISKVFQFTYQNKTQSKILDNIFHIMKSSHYARSTELLRTETLLILYLVLCKWKRSEMCGEILREQHATKVAKPIENYSKGIGSVLYHPSMRCAAISSERLSYSLWR